MKRERGFKWSVLRAKARVNRLYLRSRRLRIF
jgi:hypothetical protein